MHICCAILSTVGSRAFPVAAAKIWNAFPDSLVSITSLSQRPNYIEEGPLMTTRFGEVRSGTAKGQELMI